MDRWLFPGVAVMVLAGLAYLGVIVWAGSAATASALRGIGLGAVLLGMGVSAATLLLRFVRWRAILLRLGHRLPTGFSLRVYLAGIAMSATPGKLGETLRSVLLLGRQVPLPHSLGAFVADRVSDVIGVAGLGALAAWLVGQRQPVLEGLALLGLLGATVAAPVLRRLAPAGAGWVAAARPPVPAVARAPAPAWVPAAAPPRLAGWLARLASPAQAWAQAWQGSGPLLYIGCAVAAYGVQAGVFTGYVWRVAPTLPAADGVAIYTAATLIGAASGLPGGLGAMDSALVLQLQARGVALPDALAAALATRASTLWLAWLIGCGAALSCLRAQPGRAAEPGPAGSVVPGPGGPVAPGPCGPVAPGPGGVLR